jgi:hypothetical protein
MSVALLDEILDSLADDGDKGFQIGRFGDEAVRSQCDRVLLVLRRSGRRENRDWHTCHGRVEANRPQDVQAIDSGNIQVENNKIRYFERNLPQMLKRPQGAFSILEPRQLAFDLMLVQRFSEEKHVGRVIFHENNADPFS